MIKKCKVFVLLLNHQEKKDMVIVEDQEVEAETKEVDIEEEGNFLYKLAHLHQVLHHLHHLHHLQIQILLHQ